MPSQPPDPYSRQFNFTGHEQTLPTKPLPGSKVDLELNEVRESLNATISRLNEIQADDGSIRDTAISGTLDQKVTAAESARNDAVSAKVEAVAAKDQSQILFNNINGYGTSVLIQANSAATNAAASAQAAALSASSASNSYQQTQTLAGQITASGNTAATSAATAQSAATTATGSATAAQGYAVEAGTYRNQAATSATNALASSNSAATSFQQAQNSSNSAGTHAFNAAASAQAAETAAASVTGVTYTAPLQKVGSAVSIDPAYKPNPFDQTLNTTSSPTFQTVTVGATIIDSLQATFNDITLNSIQFGDATVQSTAFPPASGTVSQYIDGTGALKTFPAVGDRYLTSSTSTLTIDNGNGKTMTVGTGLAYTAQQDITVVYNNSNHMHGTVTSYNSGTGVLVFDSNTHSGGGTYSNWVVNVGGVAGAILPVGGTAGQVLSKINSTNYNTEWVSLASASDTVAGIVELATDAEAIAGTSTSVAVTPAAAKAATDAQLVDIQTFGGPSSSGTFTWTKPAGAKLVQVRLHGAGGGGASGRCQGTGVSRSGGGGGGGGSSSVILIPAAELGATVSVIVGAGGAGGAGSDVAGGGLTNGTAGGVTSFGKYRTIFGNPGNGATAGGGLAGTVFQIINSALAGNGGAGAAAGGVTAGSFTGGQFLATGGGGGGGQPAGSTAGAVGGAGGSRVNTVSPTSYSDTLAGGAAGNAAGTSGTAGTNQDVAFAAGTGGGGGGYATGVATGSGGNGGWPGGGGGGGAASDTGFMSGAGGTGANGMVTVITYF